MGEEITNPGVSETQSANTAVEENTVATGEPQVTNQEEVTDSNNAENSNGENQQGNSNEVEEEQQNTDTPSQPTVEELQAKLKEYEVKEEEDRLLREQLGLGDVDQQTYNYMNIDQQIVNEGKQVYLRLCNDYGIDANPEKIDASVQQLKQTDPAKAYEFERRFEQLGMEVETKRQAIQQQNAIYEINKFEQDYSQLLQAAPALNNIMAQYVQANRGNTSNMYRQLKSVVDIILPAYQEAFNAGKQYALQDKAKKDTSGVQGGIATANIQTYTPDTVFTREQISRMSSDEFAKYEKQIRQQMLEGKIQ